VRADKARATGEQIDSLCQMDLLGDQDGAPLSGMCVNVYIGIPKFKFASVNCSSAYLSAYPNALAACFNGSSIASSASAR
jgi:hypothetical protein